MGWGFGTVEHKISLTRVLVRPNILLCGEEESKKEEEGAVLCHKYPLRKRFPDFKQVFSWTLVIQCSRALQEPCSGQATSSLCME